MVQTLATESIIIHSSSTSRARTHVCVREREEKMHQSSQLTLLTDVARSAASMHTSKCDLLVTDDTGQLGQPGQCFFTSPHGWLLFANLSITFLSVIFNPLTLLPPARRSMVLHTNLQLNPLKPFALFLLFLAYHTPVCIASFMTEQC